MVIRSELCLCRTLNVGNTGNIPSYHFSAISRRKPAWRFKLLQSHCTGIRRQNSSQWLFHLFTPSPRTRSGRRCQHHLSRDKSRLWGDRIKWDSSCFFGRLARPDRQAMVLTNYRHSVNSPNDCIALYDAMVFTDKQRKFRLNWGLGNHTWGFANPTKLQPSSVQVEYSRTSSDIDWVILRVAGAPLRESNTFPGRGGYFCNCHRLTCQISSPPKAGPDYSIYCFGSDSSFNDGLFEHRGSF